MYDGTAYSGYQAQPDRPSVQKTLTEAFTEGFGFPCTVTGCSRTDAGVHALGFCAAVEPVSEDDRITVPTGRVHRAVRRYLPEDISICGEADVPDELHPRYSVIGKEYLYRMYDTVYEDPFERTRAWHLKHPLSDRAIERMNEAAAYLVGRHDFTSFMATGSSVTDAVRSVYSCEVTRSGSFVELRISADGFLYNMVRIITGTLADYAIGDSSPERILHMLEKRDRSAAGRTAPPHGLYLARVWYDRELEWKIE